MLVFLDPFESYSMGWLVSALEPLIGTDAVALNHLHEIAIIFVWCQAYHFVVGILLDWYFTKYNQSRSIINQKKDSLQMQIVCFSTYSAFFLSIIPLLGDPVLTAAEFHRNNAYTPYAGCVASCELGFHAFLLYRLLRGSLFWFEEIFIIQQMAYVVVFANYLRPLSLQTLWEVVLVDCSSVFVYGRWLMLTIPSFPEWVRRAIDCCLVSSLLVKFGWSMSLVCRVASVCPLFSLCWCIILGCDAYWGSVLCRSFAGEVLKGEISSPVASSPIMVPKIQIEEAEEVGNDTFLDQDMVFNTVIHETSEVASLESDDSRNPLDVFDYDSKVANLRRDNSLRWRYGNLRQND